MLPGVPKSCLLDDSVWEGHNEEIAAMVAPLGDGKRNYPEEYGRVQSREKKKADWTRPDTGIGGQRRTVGAKQERESIVRALESRRTLELTGRASSWVGIPGGMLVFT